jgi:hypothetical protein
MIKRALSLLILLITCATALAPVAATAAQAQANLTLTAVQVDLWPEYDRPSMLVIYHITLSNTLTFPVDISLKIPAAAIKPTALAERQADGSLINILNYSQGSEGNWVRLQFKTSTPQVQLEYYDPTLTKQGAKRHYDFQWPGDYAIQSLTMRVQQPLGVEGMQIAPNPGAGKPGDDGLLYYSAEVGAVSAGQSFHISVDYQKASDGLSAANLPVQPSAPINDQMYGRLALSSALPWALGALGIMLIVGGGYWYWRSGQPKIAAVVIRRRPASQPQTATAVGTYIYCHNCGKRAEPSDRFCRTCGRELRTR